MNQLDLPLEQPKKVLELKLEIISMQADLKSYEVLQARFMTSFRYEISRKQDELRKICLHTNTISNELWDHHNNVGYTHVNCVDCGKLVKSI
jgi:hypothetical protein